MSPRNAQTELDTHAAPALTAEQAWEASKKRHAIDEIVGGKVVQVEAWGAFFDIGEQFLAFIDPLDLGTRELTVGSRHRLRVTQHADWNRQIRVTLAGSESVNGADSAGTEFPLLESMFSCYFHQDWDTEGTDWRDLIQNYARDESANPTLVASEINQLLENCGDDEQLHNELMGRFHCYYAPRADLGGPTVREWLRQVAALLRQSERTEE